MGYQPTTLNELKPGDCVMRFDGRFNTVLGIFSDFLVVYSQRSDKIVYLAKYDFWDSVYKYVEQ